MPLPLRRIPLFVLAVALCASAGTGQPLLPPPPKPELKPLDVPPTYTAFPDLKPATRAKRADGKAAAADEGLPPVPLVPDTDPPLRRVQSEQVREGLEFLRRSEAVIRLGAWDIDMLRDYAGVAAVVYGVAAELEEKPAGRVPWFEARVRKLKEVEGHVERAVRTGGLQAQALNVARFQRLQAEADLLRLKADVEKGKGK